MNDMEEKQNEMNTTVKSINLCCKLVIPSMMERPATIVEIFLAGYPKIFFDYFHLLLVSMKHGANFFYYFAIFIYHKYIPMYMITVKEN